MSWYSPTSQQALYRQLPKVDLHRHLEGSLRLETLMETVKVYEISIPIRPDFSSLVQMQPGDPLNSSVFLSKFQFLRLFYRTPELIARFVREAIEDAANDGVLYLDLNFTPVALSRYNGFHLADVMDWVAEAAARASQDFGITVRLIASVNRHESPDLAAEVARLAAERISRGIVALDLAGNEADFPAGPFVQIFKEAKDSGLALTIHAGEWNGPENVRQALEELKADRIVHGVRAIEDPRVAALACELGVPFEVCLTSNHQTGVISSLQQHPVKQMLRSGINVTFNTDDPSISQITLSDEYQVACEELSIPHALLVDRVLAAAQSAFLPPAEKALLVEKLKAGMSVLVA